MSTVPDIAPEEASRQPCSMELHHAITQHYYREARMLQDCMYREWLAEMVAEDIHYWMPVREQRFIRDRRPPPTPADAAIFNDDHEMLHLRVERMNSGQVWMEDPPSRIRYIIANIEAFHGGNDDEFEVFCNFSVHRHRRQREHSIHTGGREDLLRRDGEGFRLARRKILLDARVVQDKNLYFFA